MDRATLLSKIFWQIQAKWHLRHHPAPQDLSITDTVKGLQACLLATQGAMLAQTLQYAFGHPVALSELQRLDIMLYQEGIDQRVWRAQATLHNGDIRAFGFITARSPEASSTLTQQDFQNLQVLHTQQPRYCATPYVCGMMPIASGVTVYTMEWLDAYKELVFDITHDGGSFLVNAHNAHRAFSRQESRQIWRRLMEILCWYPGLRRVNIQAGDFVARQQDDGSFALKLTTARELTAEATLVEPLHTLLRSVITASGYLSDGRHPFDRHMPQAVFLHRMTAVLQRRFGLRAADLARRQWVLFQQGAFAQQEDGLKEDCVLATLDRLRAEDTAPGAWLSTCQRWTAYAQAVQQGRLAASWWFPAAEIPAMLCHIARQYGFSSPAGSAPTVKEHAASDTYLGKGARS